MNAVSELLTLYIAIDLTPVELCVNFELWEVVNAFTTSVVVPCKLLLSLYDEQCSSSVSAIYVFIFNFAGTFNSGYFISSLFSNSIKSSSIEELSSGFSLDIFIVFGIFCCWVYRLFTCSTGYFGAFETWELDFIKFPAQSF